MDAWGYCRLHADEAGDLYVSYFDRSPSEAADQRPGLVKRLGWRRTPDPETDGTREAMRHLEHEGWLPAGDIPARDDDAAFERSYQRLTG
jgi:hypothetical protein